MYSVGFTGTRQGMSVWQKEQLRVELVRFLAMHGTSELHHGDCVGADAQAHDIATSLGYRTVAHVPDSVSRRAFCLCSEYRSPAPYLERNRHIVDAVSLLIAAPLTDEQQLRSGTWATIRYARHRGRAYLILPR